MAHGRVRGLKGVWVRRKKEAGESLRVVGEGWCPVGGWVKVR